MPEVSLSEFMRFSKIIHPYIALRLAAWEMTWVSVRRNNQNDKSVWEEKKRKFLNKQKKLRKIIVSEKKEENKDNSINRLNF